MSKIDNSRMVAVRLISGVMEKRRVLSELTESPSFLSLKPPQRARAQRLATETLRGLTRADSILSKYLTTMPASRVMNIMRMAAYELCTGGEAHGVVNEAVKLVASEKKYSKFAGLVNAVLRRVAETGPKTWPILRPARLPKWMRVPLKNVYGSKIVTAIERAHSKIPPVDLTIKHASNIKKYASLLSGEIVLGHSVRLAQAGQISKLEGYDIGDWWVQDAAAAIPVRLLGALEGATALDLCAAPGGKTLQLAAGGADVTAVDISPKRLKILEENLKRTGLKANVKMMDAFNLRDRSFDVIVLDAPCSATGTLRRHPDLPFTKNGSGVGKLLELQEKLLDHALSLLKPEGRLIYCTCSLLPLEGEVQILKLLSRNKNTELDLSILEHSFLEKKWLSDNVGVRLRPDYLSDNGGMDGFFVSLLYKKA